MLTEKVGNSKYLAMQRDGVWKLSREGKQAAGEFHSDFHFYRDDANITQLLELGPHDRWGDVAASTGGTWILVLQIIIWTVVGSAALVSLVGIIAVAGGLVVVVESCLHAH